ncbi:MAG TPA: phosphohydrolase [Bacillota bacterium]|nr:phosphohydrolase [Bacillota bacterium]
MRLLSCITTYSGEDFDPLQPDAAKIQIEDIAHALSLMCRANGHFQRFYSVAQHCVNCAVEARARSYSKKVQLACLLHDASEAYISDITRPVKPHLANYMEIEERLQNLIYHKFIAEPFSPEELAQIRQIDDALLVCEFNALMSKPVFDYEPDIAGNINFEAKSFESVESQYLRIWVQLTGQKGVCRS